MDKEKIKEEVFKHSQNIDGKWKIECNAAYDVAFSCNVKISDVAKVINENNIKITKCQLGCF
ncbi:MAG: hypothetical protein PHT69_12490 [Bacteroidales bacterium]|nr:hypothetical protein [Bacteroidales bacterium]